MRCVIVYGADELTTDARDADAALTDAGAADVADELTTDVSDADAALTMDAGAADGADELTTDARDADAALTDARAADAALTSAAGVWRQNTSPTEKLPVSACLASK